MIHGFGAAAVNREQGAQAVGCWGGTCSTRLGDRACGSPAAPPVSALSHGAAPRPDGTASVARRCAG